jgi:4-hydroxy-3-methylbut-2-enyl diphosphate reductase
LIETEDEIRAEDLIGVEEVGVTAGASTPNWLIEKVINHLEEIGANAQKEMALK